MSFPKYRVTVFRQAGLEARWTKTGSGAPIIAARKPGDKTWFVVDSRMWDRMNQVGIFQGFEEYTLLGHLFSLPA